MLVRRGKPIVRTRLLQRLYKPEVDPQRAERTLRHFDRERGFAGYHALCRDRLQRPATPPEVLLRDGFEHFPVLEPAQAADWLERIQASAPVRQIKKNRRALRGHLLTPQLIDSLLDAVLTNQVDARLTGYFGSEYLVYWLTASMTLPGRESATVSFRWHCDKGPRAHLKLIVYLNGSAQHGGNTEFVSLRDTAAVAARGYVFGSVRQRSSEIATLARIAGRPIVPRRREISPGMGILFQPAGVLHRGITPVRGARYVLTLCLLPSPVPWWEAHRRDVMIDLAEDEKWPAHADELLALVDVDDVSPSPQRV